MTTRNSGRLRLVRTDRANTIDLDDAEPLLAADASFREWLAARGGFRWTTRRVPGLALLTVTLSLTGRCESGHGWMYEGLVRRDTVSVGGRGLVLLSVPNKRPAAKHVARGAA